MERMFKRPKRISKIFSLNQIGADFICKSFIGGESIAKQELVMGLSVIYVSLVIREERLPLNTNEDR
jgi:hypothetical protein